MRNDRIEDKYSYGISKTNHRTQILNVLTKLLETVEKKAFHEEG